MSYYKNNQPQQPQTEQIKLKINNSYESEPSTGSGSSLSENNEGNAFDEEYLRLPHILNPQSQIRELAAVVPMTASKSTKHDLHSSQESPFHGFGDSPFNKLQQKIYKESPHKPLPINKNMTSSQESPFEGFSYSPPGKQQTVKNEETSPAKLVFSRFYEFLLENSCNAVDIELPCASVAPKELDVVKPAEQELSFNGKIKNLSENLKQNEIEKQTDDKLLANTLLQTEKSFTLRTHNIQKSPDLFIDDEETNVENDDEVTNAEMKETSDAGESNIVAEDAITMLPQELSTFTRNSEWSQHCERELLRRTRICLSGVPPPPSHTILQLNMFEEVKKRKANILNFFDEIVATKKEMKINPVSSSLSGNLFKVTHTLQETQSMPWNQILAVRQHGLSYNLSKASEDYEYLSLSVIERFIGAETTTSYRSEPSSDKKRKSRLKMLTQSPGNRLSHLAKRRSVFSSANLASTSQKSVGMQILVDRIKIKAKRRGTPKRSTPNSKRKRKTPSSSARKRLYRCDLNKPGPTRETSKRALFQSPAKQNKPDELRAPLIRPLQIKPEIATRLEKSKRALFSPDKSISSQSLLGFDRIFKRKRQDSENDDSMISQSSKFFRGNIETITPRSLKIKSQSFCMGAFPTNSLSTRPDAFAMLSNPAQTNFGQASSNENLTFNRDSNKHLLHRAQSELILQSQSLTENQRKKLLWAVSQALQERKIAVKHEKFKEYASVLARVVRRIFQEFYQKSSTSNSETLLRLSKKYVFHVIAGRQADDIYRQAKVHIEESARLSRTRLSGYIGPEEYEKRKLAAERVSVAMKTNSMQNLFVADNSMDSCSMSWSCANETQMSQSLYSGSSIVTAATPDSQRSCSQESEYPSIPANPSLQNSSSKNNMGPVLRENALDAGEQRRSAQKSSAKKSMLNQLLATDCNKQTQLLNNFNFNSARAKRNISFDI